MLNIFATETVYGGWSKKGNNIPLKNCTDPALFNAMDDVATVTESDKGYGLSMCFTIHNGANRVYKKLSTTSKLKVGDTISKDKLYVSTLQKLGENDVYVITEEE